MADIEHKDLTLDVLASSIRQLHEHLSNSAKHAVNVALTLRNWLIGYYIAEYELHGADKAKYGEKVVSTLAEKLKDISNCNRFDLYRYMRFYRNYPQIVGTLSQQLEGSDPAELSNANVPTVSALLPKEIVGTLLQQLSTASPVREVRNKNQSKLIECLSYNHFALLVQVEDATARQFYETECIRGNWSVRELRRQIGSLFYERTALSTNKKKMVEVANATAEHDSLPMTIRDPYVFDFLGLKTKELVSERQLEDALLDKLQDFLLELGRGFCFEARQKRLLIGDEYFDVDLVFYHRILKCHVLIELKDEPFSHENIGQLNTYVSYYQKNEMSEGDNPPIGILLCTQKNNELVEYALAGLNQKLFVSKYQLALPTKKDMEDFIREQRAELDADKE